MTQIPKMMKKPQNSIKLNVKKMKWLYNNYCKMKIKKNKNKENKYKLSKYSKYKLV